MQANIAIVEIEVEFVGIALHPFRGARGRANNIR